MPNVCTKCGRGEPEVQFNLRPNGRKKTICKECQKVYSRGYYAENRQATINYAVAYRRAQRKELRSSTHTLKSVPCADSGGNYPPWVMQFDHVRGEKDFDISAAISRGVSKKVMLTEIEKCEVVCANCHLDRTYRRMFDIAPVSGSEAEFPSLGVVGSNPTEGTIN